MKFTFRAKFNKNNNMNTLTKIKNLRKSHKYTQNFVAKHIETSGPNYSRYESGERNFTIEHILDDSSDPIKNGQIGNLLPLENSKNSKCNGKSLEEKLLIYEDSIYKTTRSFSKRFKEKEFDPSVRTNYLASLFYKEILSFD